MKHGDFIKEKDKSICPVVRKMDFFFSPTATARLFAPSLLQTCIFCGLKVKQSSLCALSFASKNASCFDIVIYMLSPFPLHVHIILN